MGKRKRNPESVKRRSKARRLKKKLCASSQHFDSTSTSSQNSYSASSQHSSSSSQHYDSTSNLTDPVNDPEPKHLQIFYAECKSSPLQEEQIEVIPQKNKNPTKLVRNELHKVLVTSRYDPLVVGLKLFNELELKKRLLSSNLNIFQDPNHQKKTF